MLFPEIPLEELLDKGCWEIIDGQQRLTSLYLLYKYLMLKKGWSEEDLKEEEDGKALYHLVYATREESSKFLERLGLDALNAEKDDANTDTNIDHYHMMVAFKTIDTWLKSTGKEINERYHLSKSLEEVRNPIFRLLNGMRDTKTGSVQVLWYELDEATDSSIREFQKISKH